MENIQQYAEESWQARIRVIKNRKYIIVRKLNKDKSLGPYSPEKWQKCVELGMVKPKITFEDLENLQTALTKTNQEVNELKQELERVKAEPTSNDLLQWKVSHCLYSKTYLGKNVFCSKYYWDRKPNNIIKRFPTVTFKRSAMNFDGTHMKWRFTPHNNICGLCNPIDELFSNFNSNRLNRLQSRIKLNKDEIEKNRTFQRYLTNTAERRVNIEFPHYHCKYLGEDGYCTNWSNSKRNWNLIQKRDEQERWFTHVRSYPIICVACPTYEKPSKK